MELQQPSPKKEDDWSFLDTALDWEALLDEPILETVMENAPLDPKPSPDSHESQDTGFSFEQFLAGQQQPGVLPPVLPPLPDAAAAALPSSLLSHGRANGHSAADADYAPGVPYIPLPTDASSPDIMSRIGGLGDGRTVSGGVTSSGELMRSTSSGDGAAGRTTSASHGNSGNDADNSPRASLGHSNTARHSGSRLASARQAVITAREKNRAAQRRYRNRKKEQLQEVDEKLSELQRQLAQVQLDKEELAQRNQLLERVASMHQQRQRAEAGEAADADVADRIKSWWQDPQLVAVLEERLQLKGPFVFTVRADAPLFLTRKQIVNMPLQEFRDLYREYINALAACLLDANSNPTSTTLTRLDRLAFEAGQMKGALLVSLPTLMASMHGVLTGRLLDKTPAAAAVTVHRKQQKLAQMMSPAQVAPSDPAVLTDADWDQMAASAGFTAEQRSAILALRVKYLRSIGALAARRRDLVALIQAAMPPGGGEHPREWELLSSADAYGAHTLGAFDQLQSTLRDEHTVLMLFTLSIGRRVLTPLQHAHLNVTAFPHKPYITKLAEAVARAAPEAPSAAELMASGVGTIPGVHPTALDDALPESMREWGSMPGADLAALYPGAVFSPEMVAAASGQDAGLQPEAAAVAAVAADAAAAAAANAALSGGQANMHVAADAVAA